MRKFEMFGWISRMMALILQTAVQQISSELI
jgi:hypothetical protein